MTKRCGQVLSRLHCDVFSGAALSAHVWNALDEIAVEATGSGLPM